jgi:hypothetical protein
MPEPGKYISNLTNMPAAIATPVNAVAVINQPDRASKATAESAEKNAQNMPQYKRPL